ncbi:MAG: NAD(+)/NADH kinase [Promicromonosporaceae bacterium]|nr:NAD(+)/NADH kinase [Promicromonosporaceae bacterium]
MDWHILVILGIVLVLIASTLLIWYRTWLTNQYWSRRNRAASRVSELASLTGQQIGVVINPSKDGAQMLREQITAACIAAALPAPRFYETTVEDPGISQTQHALVEGADLVIAAGGDGTVRAVATGMVHTGIPMAVIPIGTGNLLARNLDLPIGALDKLLAIAISGSLRRIDVGWLQVSDNGVESVDGTQPEKWNPQLFTVIIGVGFDAAMITDTDENLKKRLGWFAYFWGASKNLKSDRITAQVQLDERDPVELEARTIMIGNCGRIPGGLTLLTKAEIDDGILDVAAVDTVGGLAGWAGLFGEVLLQGAGLRDSPHPRVGRIDMAQAQYTRVELGEPAPAQVDGDPIGMARTIDVWADKDALLIRVP